MLIKVNVSTQKNPTSRPRLSEYRDLFFNKFLSYFNYHDWLYCRSFWNFFVTNDARDDNHLQRNVKTNNAFTSIIIFLQNNNPYNFS